VRYYARLWRVNPSREANTLIEAITLAKEYYEAGC
jgi:hypothetical protein